MPSEVEKLDGPGTGVTGGCELPNMVCWELNWGPLEEWYVLSTLEPPSLHVFDSVLCCTRPSNFAGWRDGSEVKSTAALLEVLSSSPSSLIVAHNHLSVMRFGALSGRTGYMQTEDSLYNKQIKKS